MVSIENNARLTYRLKNFSRWDGWVVAFGGGIVLLGWSLGNEVLKRILPGLVAMNPVTALGFILAGASLLSYWLAEGKDTRHWEYGRALADILIVIGALKLGEYIFGWHLAFDQTLFRIQLQNDGTGFPNQIAPNTAFNFVLSGFALRFLHAPVRRFSRWGQNLSLMLAFVSLVPLVGYFYRAGFLYSIGSYIPMALHTATLFFLLAMGILVAQTDSGVVALFTSLTPGGSIARRLLPFAFAVPIALGALTIWTEKERVCPEFGITVVVVGSIAIFTGLIWWNAILLNRADYRRCEAEEALQRAHDRLELRVLERTAEINNVNAALRRQVLELLEAQEKIREQAELLNKAQDAILVWDMQRRIAFWSRGAERLYGWTAEEVIGKNADELFSLDGASLPEGCGRILETSSWQGELEQTTKTGQKVIVESRWTLVNADKGAPKCILIINTDVTEKKKYEAQMLRSQRMDSIGTLAGGIAHDLNNTLSPVIMGTELLKQSRDEGERKQVLEMMAASAQRGADMVKQILSFARGSKGPFRDVPLHRLLGEMAKFIRDTFPKSILVNVQVPKDLKSVSGDITELHQVLLNLCVNARDAMMPKGGELTLRAENVTLDGGNLPSHKDAAPGSYVVLSVSDTGTGIPPEVLPRIFEAFFTTKTTDKGTGLGLSTVAGILKHHNGFIQVQSEVGKGAVFEVYLPVTEPVEVNEAKTLERVLPKGNGEMILVMDDEDGVRQLAKTALENYGYRVVTAMNGLQGMTCFEEHRREITVLVSDTDMPVLDGIVTIRAIQQLKPDLPVILASGGKNDTSHFQRIDTTHLITLGKPFTVENLLNAVAKAIHQASKIPD